MARLSLLILCRPALIQPIYDVIVSVMLSRPALIQPIHGETVSFNAQSYCSYTTDLWCDSLFNAQSSCSYIQPIYSVALLLLLSCSYTNDTEIVSVIQPLTLVHRVRVKTVSCSVVLLLYKLMKLPVARLSLVHCSVVLLSYNRPMANLSL
jgi:hypothetical protein